MKIVDKILSVIVWVLLLYAYLGSLFFSISSFDADGKITLIRFSVAVLLTLIKIIYYKYVTDVKEKILNAILPYAYFAILVLGDYDGYNSSGEIRGFAYMLFKNNKTLGFICFVIFFSILWLLIVYKTKLALNRFSGIISISEKPRRIITISVAGFVPLLVVVNLIYYLIVGKTSFELLGSLMLAPFYYWIGFFAFRLGVFMAEKLEDESIMEQITTM